MSAGSNIFSDDLLEIPAWNTFVVKENIIAVLMKILENRECSPEIYASVTDENGFFDACGHGFIPCG